MSTEPDEFPQLWQKPAYEDLLDCLKKLRVTLPAWGHKAPRNDVVKQQEATAQQRRQVTSFLSSIISSNLAWLENDDQREELWNEASKRLAERCGRTAMGEITRAFPFASETHQAFDLTIREPPLTGDSLGLKTWGSSYVLAQLLPQFAATSFSHLIRQESHVLELGSGTGLLGLAAACFLRLPVMLTDLPTIMPNLMHNVESNRSIVESMGGAVTAAPLTWGDPEETDIRFQKVHQYGLVIAADPLYDDDHPALVARAIHEQMSLQPGARALVMVPLRDETTKKLLAAFCKELTHQSRPFVRVEASIEKGQDDWGGDDEAQQVDCWWGIFRRQGPENLEL